MFALIIQNVSNTSFRKKICINILSKHNAELVTILSGEDEKLVNSVYFLLTAICRVGEGAVRLITTKIPVFSLKSIPATVANKKTRYRACQFICGMLRNSPNCSKQLCSNLNLMKVFIGNVHRDNEKLCKDVCLTFLLWFDRYCIVLILIFWRMLIFLWTQNKVYSPTRWLWVCSPATPRVIKPSFTSIPSSAKFSVLDRTLFTSLWLMCFSLRMFRIFLIKLFSLYPLKRICYSRICIYKSVELILRSYNNYLRMDLIILKVVILKHGWTRCLWLLLWLTLLFVSLKIVLLCIQRTNKNSLKNYLLGFFLVILTKRYVLMVLLITIRYFPAVLLPRVFVYW